MINPPPQHDRPSRAEKLAGITTALAFLHHIDHVLRHDHSGWPFRPEVTPFTYSLSVYIVIAVVLFGRAWPRLRVALSGMLAVFPTLAHLLLETPIDQYQTWASRPEVNLLRVDSPFLGIAAVLITVLLSFFALFTFIAFLRTRGA